jgi:hypothetical protein
MGLRIAGTCYVKIDGQQIEIKGGLEAPLAEVKREGVTSSTGVVGFKESPVVPSLKVTGIFTRDFPIEVLRAGTDLTVTGEFANGKVYTLSGGWLSNEGTAKGEEGEVDLEFSGTRGIWQ